MLVLLRFLVFSLLIFPFTSLRCLNAQEFVTLRSLQGLSIRALVEKVEPGHVVLRREDGVRFKSPLSLFDLKSRAYLLRERQRLLSLPRTTPIVPASPSGRESGVPSPKTVSPESSQKDFRALNKIIGEPLFADGSLWDDDPVAAGTRLRWPRESVTASQTSYRLYPPSNYRFVGARPYSAALYGDASKVTGLSLVFANKGDCFAAAGAAEEHFKDGTVTKDPRQLEKWMERDAGLVTELFENILGKPRRHKAIINASHTNFLLIRFPIDQPITARE